MIGSSVFVSPDALPIRHRGDIYRGKVRAVYWLTPADCQRLIERRRYDIPADASLGLMVISDRISAFDCIWRAEDGLDGVPGKGAALNAISLHLFEQLSEHDVAPHHVVEAPHPMLWVVRKARTIRFEAIIRAFITGSMWRAYAKGTRQFCGLDLPNGLLKNQALAERLLTPTTKGTLLGLEGVPETEDAPISIADILRHLEAFGLRNRDDLDAVTRMASDSFSAISAIYASSGQHLVDTKFEFGWITDANGVDRISLIDEIGTPDSSRVWDIAAYEEGKIVDSTKEGFRQMLLSHLPNDVLLDGNAMEARQALALDTRLPQSVFREVSQTYQQVAEQICGKPLEVSAHPREEIIAWLSEMELLEGPN